MKNLQSLYLCEVNNDLKMSKLTKKSLLPIFENFNIEEHDMQYITMCSKLIQNVASVKSIILTWLILTCNLTVDNTMLKLIIIKNHALFPLYTLDIF